MCIILWLGKPPLSCGESISEPFLMPPLDVCENSVMLYTVYVGKGDTGEYKNRGKYNFLD